MESNCFGRQLRCVSSWAQKVASPGPWRWNHEHPGQWVGPAGPTWPNPGSLLPPQIWPQHKQEAQGYPGIHKRLELLHASTLACTYARTNERRATCAAFCRDQDPKPAVARRAPREKNSAWETTNRELSRKLGGAATGKLGARQWALSPFVPRPGAVFAPRQ